MKKNFTRLFGIIVLLFFFQYQSVAQTNTISKWTNLLNTPYDKNHYATELLWDSLQLKPVAEITSIVNLLNKNSSKSNGIKLDLIKAIFCKTLQQPYEQNDWKYWGNKALKQANLSQDEGLKQVAYWQQGVFYFDVRNYDTCIFYMIKSIEIAEKLQFSPTKIAVWKIITSNAMVHTHNYKQSLEYCREALKERKSLEDVYVITALNNMGLSYQKLQMYDSALYFFNDAAAFAKQKNMGVWNGITTGNIGDVFYLQNKEVEAIPYWQKDYDSCMKYAEYGNAALTLAYISRYQFHNGEKQKAMQQLKWAYNVALSAYNSNNFIDISKILGECYGELQQADSANYYTKLYYHNNDSLHQVISRNNFNAIQLQLNYENDSHEMLLLRKEQRTQMILRNFLLVLLFVAALIGILLYNRQKLKVKLSEQQKKIAEAETAAANEQLLLFTNLLLQKNEQIEQLNISLDNHNTTTNEELIHKTLLTDYDWNMFKDLFEKTHPSFFKKLTDVAPGITNAEMRLATLIKLNLGNKQMASMQGISLSGLRATKTRLRQKLNISADDGLENLIKGL